jgi:hypothetical protein
MSKERKAPAVYRVITIELDKEIYARVEKDRVDKEIETGSPQHQKRFYAEIIEAAYKRKKI